MTTNERFDRQTRLPGWSQERLADATAVVIGVGALGNEVSRLLAMAGFGELILCDLDRIEESNLSRTVLFRGSDIGRFKSDVAVERLSELAPKTRLASRPTPLINGVGLAELRDASIVLSCLDSRAARLQLADRCGLVRAAWIDGGTGPWGGELRSFLNRDGPCYGCMFTPEQRAAPDPRQSCAEAIESPQGAAGLESAIVGAWMANFAIRHVMELPVAANVLMFDLAGCQSSVGSIARSQDCPFHEPLPMANPIQISPQNTLGELHSIVAGASSVFAWCPIIYESRCVACGTKEHVAFQPPDGCPSCGSTTRFRRTLDLSELPPTTRLCDAGIPNGEILMVKTGVAQEIKFVELAGSSQSNAITGETTRSSIRVSISETA